MPLASMKTPAVITLLLDDSSLVARPDRRRRVLPRLREGTALLIRAVEGFGNRLQSVIKPTILCGITTIVGLFYGACATGPKYTYTQQKDSASIEGPKAPRQGAEDGSCIIRIIKMDGLVTSFMASEPGLNWAFYSASRLYLTPGKHEVTLDISDSREVDGASDGFAIVGDYSADAAPTIAVNFAGNHTYRFAATWAGSVILLTLWDETAGFAKRVQAGSWTFDSNSSYFDNTLPSGHRR